MGNCISSKTNNKNNSNTSHASNTENKKSNTKLDLNLHGCTFGAETFGRYPPINFRKIQKSGFRVGAHVDIGFKDFEAGATFGKNNIHEIQFSENNNHLKLLKSLENEESTNNNSKEKDKIINTLMNKIIKKDDSSSSEIVE